LLKDYASVFKQIIDIVNANIYCFVINFREIVVYFKLYTKKVIKAKEKYYLYAIFV